MTSTTIVGTMFDRKEAIKELLATNVNNHTEKKNNLTYLSWAWAWAEALKADPAASFNVHAFDGKAYMDVNGTGLVWVTVTMFEKPMTCMLPVMNHRNQPIPAPNAFEVNTAIMRCMTKALSLHGLGLYIYAGEDIPEGGATIKPTDGVIVDKNRENIIADVAIAVADRINADDLIGAYEEYLGIHDQEEKVALWALLPSNVRSALKKHGESLKA